MDILEKMSSAETSDVAPPDIPQPNKCVAIIHTMAAIQSMDKPSWIRTCKDLSAHFIAFIQIQYDENDELHILFDRYDNPKSLLSQQQGIYGLVVLTLWHITAQTLQIFQMFH